jgi:putative SOS response-associated peptidase YedK
MCYHLQIKRAKEALERRYKVHAELEDEEETKVIHHANAFDLPLIPIVTAEASDTLQYFRWGLIPNWVKDDQSAQEIRLKTFNARSETLTEKPSFRGAIETQRCLVPCTGFYEWQTVDGKKYPHYITTNNQPIFSLAGLYDTWISGTTGDTIQTFTVITTAANSMMERIHNTKKRMPVILTPETEQLWINNELPQQQLLQLLQPYDETNMQAHTISRLISTREANSNVEEVTTPHIYTELTNTQTSLF